MWGTKSTRTLAVGVVSLVLVASVGIGAMAGGIGAMTGDGGNEGGAQDGGDARVRIAHMSPDAPPVDVLVDNETVASNLSYGNVTEYANLSAGEHNVTITAAGDRSAVVFSGNVSFEADTNYTVTATGEISEDANTSFEPVVFEDNFTAPGAGNASVRLVHVSPDAPPVDVTVEGTNATLFDNVSFRNATAYEEVPAGNYTLEVRPATENDDGPVVATFDVTLNESTAYSAFAAGYVNPADAPEGTPDRPFELILVEDFVFKGAQKTTAADHETTAKETTAEKKTTTAKETTRKTTAAKTTTTAKATTTAKETTAAKETTVKETTAKQTTTTTAKETTPKETTVVKKRTTPKETTAKETTPKETVRKKTTTPNETTTATTVRETTANETVVKKRTTPETTAANKTTPKETVKETTTANETTTTTERKKATPKEKGKRTTTTTTTTTTATTTAKGDKGAKTTTTTTTTTAKDGQKKTAEKKNGGKKKGKRTAPRNP